MTSKQELRQYIRALKKQHLIGDQFSCEVLLHHPRSATSHTVLAYSALPDEVPTQALIDQLAEQGKMVLLPRVISNTDMELRRYTGLQDLQEGAFGIMEPCGELFTDYGQIDVAVIPGMAFDAEGRRLGRGRGYYDRFLSRVPFIYKIGLCFGFQLVEEVPTDENDIRMDLIISGNECRQ